MYGELWLNIKETGYKVSNRGNVLNKKGKLVKGTFNERGDRSLNVGGKIWRVNRLVATYFIPNPLNLAQVNHKDENPLNNDASNLEWCTPLYNIRYGTRTQRQAETSKKRKGHDFRSGKPVIGIHVETGEIIEYRAMRHGIKDDIYAYGITRCLKGIWSTYKGYTWHVNKGNKEEIITKEMFRRNVVRVMKTFTEDHTKIMGIVKENPLILNDYKSVRSFLMNYGKISKHIEMIKKEIEYINVDIDNDFIFINEYLKIGNKNIVSSIKDANIKEKSLNLLSFLFDGKTIIEIGEETNELANSISKSVGRLSKKINNCVC